MAKTKSPKKVKEVEPFFKELVETYFSFCRDKLNEEPSFDGSSPRDLKAIVKTLRDRAEKSGYEWTVGTARFRFNNFLEFAFKDKWLSENWLLFNINRQKDKIFFQIRKSITRTTVDPFE